MVGTKVEKNVLEQVYEAIEQAKSSGKLKKGTNEVTKAVERGDAKLVAIASDISPVEIVMHLPPLCKEKKVPCIEVGTKDDLGAAAGLTLGTSTIAVVNEGDARDLIAKLADKLG